MEKLQSNNQFAELGPYLYSFKTFRFMLQVVEAVVAVTVIAELSVCKAVAVSGGRKTELDLIKPT